MDIFNKRMKKNMWLNFILFRKYTILLFGIVSLYSWTTLMQSCYAQYNLSRSAEDQFHINRFSTFENRQMGIGFPTSYQGFGDPNGYKKTLGIDNSLQNAVAFAAAAEQLSLQPMNDGWNQFYGPQPYPNSPWNDRLYGQNFQNYLNPSPGMPLQNTIQPVIFGQNTFFQFVTSAFLKMFANVFSPNTTTYNFNSFNAGTKLKVDMQSMGINNSTGDNEAFESRLHDAKKQQLDFYYNDPDLYNLRVEANQRFLYYLYTDPRYLYWNYKYKVAAQILYETRPIFPFFQSLSYEISLWTIPPNDTETLKERFNKRLLLMHYNTLLCQQIQYYYTTYPDEKFAFDLINSTLAQITNQAWGSDDATSWSSDWQSRLKSTHDNSEDFANVTETFEQLMDDFPAFKEYSRLNEDVADLLVTFEDIPFAKEIIDMTNANLSNASIYQKASEYYYDYKEECNDLLSTTNAMAEIERFYEQLNGLLNEGETYQLLQSTQYLAMGLLEDYQKTVYDAVYNCYAYYGNWCDPYSNQEILDLVYSNETLDLINAVGEFYELYNLFWYNFYNSQDYLNLEAEAMDKIQTALNPVLPELENLQTQYTNNINNIPEMKELKDAMNDVVFDLRSESSELDQKLTQMSQLAKDLYYNPTPPTVVSTSPAKGATNVAVGNNITATFSEEMNRSTITTSTFKLNHGVTGTVNYNSTTRTATFDPSTNLNYSTTYTATITTGVKDNAGNAMTSNYTWSFTTAPPPDTTPPTVTSTSPAKSATNVAVSSNITATFSEAMKASTITTSTFTLNNGVTGTVSYNSATRTATFNPSTNLNYSTTYTATITTGAKDVAGNPMTASYKWSFTTGTSGTDVFTAYNDLSWSAGQVNNKISLYTTGQGGLLKDYLTGVNTPVTLTIAGGYVVSGTLTQGSNANTGTDAYTVFNGIVNSVGLISYSATNLTFTFTGLDPDLNYEFVLFGNRNNASYNNRSTKTTISDVTAFTNASTAGTVFSGAADPAVTIVNGDNTINGYVARFTNIKPGADGDMLITVSSPSGGFYANALMLRATQLSDTAPPEVSTTSPVNNATGVPVNSVIKATFNEAMYADSITPSTFLVSDGIANIGGTVSYSGTTATFTPSGPLAHSTKYTATITTGVMDVAGNPMTASYKWSFTTGTSGTDVFTAYNDLAWSAGQVNNKITLYTTGQGGLLKDYLSGANTPVTMTIAGGYVVSGTLTQGSNANTGTDAYTVFNGIVNSVGLVSYSATNLTFTFTGLDPDLNYEFVLFGNRNNASYSNRSTKTTISDVTAFTNASTAGTIFSGATDPAVTIVNGDNTINGYVARFTNIKPGADGDMLITVSSPSGGFYANALMLRATQLSDTAPPEVSATSPVNNATGVPVNSVVKATFNEAMYADSITPSTFLVSDGIANIGGTVSYSGTTATFTPSGPLAHSTKYTATITTGVMDVAGNPMAASYKWSFTTGVSGANLFTAYNDLAWSAGQVNNKITLYTTGQGGLLKDYLTGVNTPVTLTIAGGYVVSGTLTQGSNANTGTDAYNIFNGIVNSVGLVSYSATNLTFTFTGLDPDLNYEFVLFGNRNNASYNNRSTKTTISDVTAFTNASTAGTVFSGAADPAVTIVNGDNTINGYVARFTNIISGADGDMLITVSSPSGGFYANALMLRATQLSETTATTVSATDVASNSNNGVLVDGSVQTTGKIDDVHKTPETGITLKSFRAKAGRDGRVTLHWRASPETDTAGFNLYRSHHKSGRYTKVNNVLINNRETDQSGERYTFSDEPDSGRSHYYKLEHVNAYGDNTLYYPIKVRMKSPRKSEP